ICPAPEEWQIALNPCIPQLEQNIHFIKDSDYEITSVEFVDEVVANSDNLVITLNTDYIYENVRVTLTDSNGEVLGTVTNIDNIYTFTLKNILQDLLLDPLAFELNHNYHLEIAVIF